LCDGRNAAAGSWEKNAKKSAPGLFISEIFIKSITSELELDRRKKRNEHVVLFGPPTATKIATPPPSPLCAFRIPAFHEHNIRRFSRSVWIPPLACDPFKIAATCF
jgi:hypothetical protein